MPLFQSLPNELLLEIARKVDQRGDLYALALVNRQCHSVADPILWKREAPLDRPGPLHWAIKEHNISLVRKALAYKANPNQPAYCSWPRLMARQTRWWDYEPNPNTQTVISHTHSRSHDSVDSAWAEFGQAFWRPLHLAVTTGRTDLVELLLDHGARVNELSWRLCDCRPHPSLEMFPNLTAEDDGWGLGFMDIKDGGWTPLHLAICHQDVTMAKLLLNRGASTEVHRDLRWHRNADGPVHNITAMHDAATHGLLPLMEFLVEEGYQSVNVESHIVGQPIHLAIWNKHFDTVVPWLQEKGASIDELCHETETTPMLVMCLKQQFDSIIRLVELGADVSARAGPSAPFTALHLLSYPVPDDQKDLGGRQNATRSDVIKCLVSKGLPVDSPDPETGYSPLIVASGFCDLDNMRTLLRCGANPNYRDTGGSTAFSKVGVLTESSKPPIYEAGRLLIDWGLDVRGPFKPSQTTPLNSLCMMRSDLGTNLFRDKQLFKLAKLLLIRGADPNESGRFNSGPVIQAIYSCAFDVASLLLESGGRATTTDFEMLMRPMVMRPSYQPGVVSYILQLDFERYGINRPPNHFLDRLIKASFVQGAWQATAELARHHRISALPPNALHRALDRSAQLLHSPKNVPLPLIRALLDKGADPNARWKDETPLYYAGRALVNGDCVKELVAAGADLDTTTPRMPQGALLFLFQNGVHSALSQIMTHDKNILPSRPAEFHSKCWGYLLRPGPNEDMMGDTLHLEAGGWEEDIGADGEFPPYEPQYELDLDEEDYALTPIAWAPIREYIRWGLRTDVDLEHGGTLRDAIKQVVSRCSRLEYEARKQVVESLGLCPTALGLSNEVHEYDPWQGQASLENGLPFP